MHEGAKKYRLFYITIFLFIIVLILFFLVYKEENKGFTFAMFDVGQGDALYIESPTGTQILVDGGPSQKVSSELRKVIPPFDKTIDAIIITNPDKDHIAGFLDILKNYEVGVVFESGTFNSSKIYQNLENEIKRQNIKKVLAKQGMVLDLGGGAYINILFPDRDVSKWKTNDGSVVAELVYGKEKIMLTGDAPKETERIILKNISNEKLQSDILKVGHHGSRGSTSLEFLKAVNPNEAWISVGEGNTYGHPHKEILDILNKNGVKILRTDEVGTLILKCDKMGKCKTNKLKN